MFSSPARSRQIWPLALAGLVVLIVGLWFGGHPSWLPSPVRSVFVSQTSDERQVQDVLNLVSQDYYRRVNTKSLLNQGLQAAIASLDDPYSHYYPPNQYTAFQNVTDPRDTGIGIDVMAGAHGLDVDEVFEGSPAARAGLVPGDVITAVGSQSLAGRTAAFSSSLIVGRAGTPLTIRVLRNGRTRTVRLIRRNVAVPEASSTLLRYHGIRIGDLRFASFTQGSGAELRGQVTQMLHAGAQALILDLRDNGGGLLAEAIKVASIFIPDGTIVTTRGRSQPTVVYTATGGAIPTTIPMVVLVNRGTASSAEIVTGALKDRGRAQVVGTHTYGKGVFQEIQPVPGGGALDITVGEYFTPNGQNLGGGGVKEGPGIAPNVYVYDNPDAAPSAQALRVAERVVAAKVK